MAFVTTLGYTHNGRGRAGVATAAAAAAAAAAAVKATTAAAARSRFAPLAPNRQRRQLSRTAAAAPAAAAAVSRARRPRPCHRWTRASVSAGNAASAPVDTAAKRASTGAGAGTADADLLRPPLQRPSYEFSASDLVRVLADPNGVAYAGFGTARTAFFLGLRLVQTNLVLNATSDEYFKRTRTQVSGAGPAAAQLNLVRYFATELYNMARLELDNIRDGYYKLPPLQGREPRSALQLTRDFLDDAINVMDARERARTHNVPQQHVDDPFYPRYYLQNFHYQTDGYLSVGSARRYEFQVEVLFGGLASAMRRQTMVPLTPFVRRTAARERRPVRVLNVPCGSGALCLDLMENYSAAQAHITNVDLSPYYVDEARRRAALVTTTSNQGGGGASLSSSSSSSSSHATAEFVHANAEKLPFDDNSFDAVTSVYMFHELPPEARERVVREFARVVRPGGRVVFADSLQRGDNPTLRAAIDSFSKVYHEPFYESYVDTDLERLFYDASGGAMRMRRQSLAFLTKVCEFEKLPVAE